MQSFMLSNIEPGKIFQNTPLVDTARNLKDIAPSVSTGEILLISICLSIIIFAPLLMVQRDERLYRSLNRKRLREAKAEELKEDFPILYPMVTSILKAAMWVLKQIVEFINYGIQFYKELFDELGLFTRHPISYTRMMVRKTKGRKREGIKGEMDVA